MGNGKHAVATVVYNIGKLSTYSTCTCVTALSHTAGPQLKSGL